MYALVDDEDYERLKGFTWWLTSHGYVSRRYQIGSGHKTRKFVTVYLHREVTGYPENLYVDHKNRNKLDNRKSNLRPATNSQNQANRKSMSTNTSGFRGVYLDKTRKKWVAEIIIEGKKHHLGRYETKEEAAIVFNEKFVAHFKDFATTNL